MAFTRSAVRSRLAPPAFARFANYGWQAAHPGGFFVSVTNATLLTAAAAALHDAGKTTGETRCRARSRLRNTSPSNATLGDSQVFGAHVWNDLGPRLLDVQDTRLREMDKHGIEMMILSLNAPAVQAIHDVKHAIAVAQAGQRRPWPPRCASGPIASPVLPRCRCRIRKRPRRSSPAASRNLALSAR